MDQVPELVLNLPHYQRNGTSGDVGNNHKKLMSERILAKHFESIRKQLSDFADHTGILAKHGDVKGAAREGIIRLFLESNLPSQVEYITGELIDCYDKYSGQLDIILKSISAPSIPLFGIIQTTMVDAALGVIEVKSNLSTGSWDKSNHLKSALETFIKVKSLKRHNNNLIGGNIGLTPVYHPNTPCFLIAYKGPTQKTLMKRLLDYGQSVELKPDEYAPEVVCVLDRRYYIYRNNGWLFPKQKDQEFCTWSGDECLAGIFVYICRIVETWNGVLHPTRYSDYLRDIGPSA